MSVALRLLLVIVFVATSGCAFRQRSSSHIVEGESSTIKYTDRESAGGRIGGR